MQTQPKIIWLTGLSGAGKTTIAQALFQTLKSRSTPAYVLDGDTLRSGLNSDLGFSPEDRRENIRRTTEVARILYTAGITVIAALISPYRADRDYLRQLFPENAFMEVFVDCPIETCETRDVKGLYQKARRGEISDFTGIHAPYEPPLNPEVHLRTDVLSLDQCVSLLLSAIDTYNL
ncbi:MAG: adenylyl-sulfate kinase [Cryomorphaceae bacterium]|nr:adenylyl-sulfate kinase [Cryomorphaceae bacterium]